MKKVDRCKRKWIRGFLVALSVAIGLWLVLEIGLRIYVELPLKADFYSSIPRELIGQWQQQYGIRAVEGPGWIHLGWIADPEKEIYSIQKYNNLTWQEIGQAEFGSFLLRDSGGIYRVVAEPRDKSIKHTVGEVRAAPQTGSPPVNIPFISGPWRPLFRPHIYGFYINDHTVYQAAAGSWRLAGITHKSDGNYAEEKYFATGVNGEFPPQDGMQEGEPLADFGELAWAPHVISENSTLERRFWVTAPDKDGAVKLEGSEGSLTAAWQMDIIMTKANEG